MRFWGLVAIFISYLTFVCNGYCQELRADVYINTSLVEGVNTQLFDLLSSQIKDAINTTKFTNIQFTEKERIDCKFSINILSHQNDEYSAELVVLASRPVFDTDYNTSLFLYRDKDLNFRYNVGEQIIFDINNPSSNLVSVISYYAYMMIDAYLSSFSHLSGSIVSTMITNIVNLSQGHSDWKGWKTMDRNNRVSIFEAFTNKQDEIFWDIWYNYHIKGLDLLSSDIKKGRDNMLSVIVSLEKYKKERFSSPLIDFIGDTKLEEIINIFVYSSSEERNSVYKILNNVYPTHLDKLERLKKGDDR